MSIEEKNRLIAEFMGCEILTPDLPKTSSAYPIVIVDGKWIQTQYHSSWDWLMPVVEKIERLGYSTAIAFDSDKNVHSAYFNKHLTGGFIPPFTKRGETKKESIYNVVIAFILWYNQNNVKP